MSFFRTIAVSASALVLATACRHSQQTDEHMDHASSGDVGAQSSEQGDQKLPPSAMHTAARLASTPRHAEWVRVPWEPGSKDSIQAWIVYPTNSSAKAPVVVVIHEIFGLSSWVRAVADQAAAEGFIAIAPDLNSRVRGGPSMDSLTADSARKLANIVTIPERNKAITAVAKYAMSQPAAVPKYAVIGFCYGGTTVWGHAVSQGTTGYSGGVAFYGSFPYSNAGVPIADSIQKINKPVMLLSGAKDTRIGASMPAIDSMMKAAGKWYYGSNYPGAVHGFARAQDDPKARRDEAEEKANLDAIKDAWPRTVTFLKTNLGVQ
jgi:carboxymethylenebutenolidase